MKDLSLINFKKKGLLYYAIPNKDHTFDKDRGITNFDHLIQDDRDNGESTILKFLLIYAKNQ